jgi:SNF2 family DNA or RNA helicase
MIRPFVLRRTKTDPEIAGDLPAKIEMKVYCNLSVEQAAMYERATRDARSDRRATGAGPG